MKTVLSDLIAGARCELAQIGCFGTVEYADAKHVRVRWDDGTVGLLYYDNMMIPNARYLIRARENKE